MPDLPDKSGLRTRILAARRTRPSPEREADDAQLVRHATELVRGRGRITAYTPLRAEPGGPGLLPALYGTGASVLLPVLRPDLDLSWALGSEELGVDAVREAELLLIPAVAVDHRGVRLGRGGGSYDRALARVPPATPIVALLYADEVLPALPAEPHDRRVTAVLTPSGLRHLPMV